MTDSKREPNPLDKIFGLVALNTPSIDPDGGIISNYVNKKIQPIYKNSAEHKKYKSEAALRVKLAEIGITEDDLKRLPLLMQRNRSATEKE